jgi:hypothetical protein
MDGALDRAGSRHTRWEYIRTQIDCNKIKDSDGAIEQLGHQGWELVDVVYTQTYVHFWLKREAR